jgi:hypothetical protein
VGVGREGLRDGFDLSKGWFLGTSTLLGITGFTIDDGIAQFNGPLASFQVHLRHSPPLDLTVFVQIEKVDHRRLTRDRLIVRSSSKIK